MTHLEARNRMSELRANNGFSARQAAMVFRAERELDTGLLSLRTQKELKSCGIRLEVNYNYA
jgi:hypothetical protein